MGRRHTKPDPFALFMTERKLAELCERDPDTVKQWRKRGQGPKVATGPDAEAWKAEAGVQIAYRVVDVASWLVGAPPAVLPKESYTSIQQKGALQAAKAGDEGARKTALGRALRHSRMLAEAGFDGPAAWEEYLAHGADEPAEPVEIAEPRTLPRAERPRSPWDALAEQIAAADELDDPFATGRSAPRRPAGYFSGG